MNISKSILFFALAITPGAGAPITPSTVNVDVMTDLAADMMSVLVQTFGFQGSQRLEYTGSYTDSSWSMQITGAYGGRNIDVQLAGLFTMPTGLGTISTDGIIGDFSWSGFGNYFASGLEGSGYMRGLDWEGTFGGLGGRGDDLDDPPRRKPDRRYSSGKEQVS